MAHLSEQDLLAYFTSSSELSKKLLSTKKKTNIAELLGFAATIAVEFPDEAQETGFLYYMTLFKALKTSIVLRVWSSPQAYYWNSITRKFLDCLLHQVDVPNVIKNYLKILDLPLHDGFKAHLNDFGRFVLSAYWLNKTNISLEVPVSAKFPTALPATVLAIDTYTEYGALTSLDHLQTINLFSVDGIVINSYDPYFNLPYIEVYPRVRDLGVCAQYAACLQESLQRIRKYRPDMADEIHLMTDVVVPMDTSASNLEMASGTASDMFGACFLSTTDNPLYLAEMLIHEFSHNKLRLLQDIDMLLKPEVLGIAKYYSPWRDDPRPLDGLQHGLFVFSNVAHFWLDVFRDADATVGEKELARRRIGTLIFQLHYAVVEFQANALLTEGGKVFLEAMKARIQDLDEKTADIDFQTNLPLFAGILRDQSLTILPISQALPQHRANWLQAYGSEVTG